MIVLKWLPGFNPRLLYGKLENCWKIVNNKPIFQAHISGLFFYILYVKMSFAVLRN